MGVDKPKSIQTGPKISTRIQISEKRLTQTTFNNTSINLTFHT